MKVAGIGILLILIGMGGGIVEARKVKNNLRVEKEPKVLNESRDASFPGTKISLNDSVFRSEEEKELLKGLEGCHFTGYDKEPNSGVESFILVNSGHNTITGFEVKINYLDMKGRMLHSRIVREACNIPPGEARRIDIKSWDRQHAYYYYLGNEPRKVATPFNVEFKAQCFWIEEVKMTP